MGGEIPGKGIKITIRAQARFHASTLIDVQGSGDCIRTVASWGMMTPNVAQMHAHTTHIVMCRNRATAYVVQTAASWGMRKIVKRGTWRAVGVTRRLARMKRLASRCVCACVIYCVCSLFSYVLICNEGRWHVHPCVYVCA